MKIKGLWLSYMNLLYLTIVFFCLSYSQLSLASEVAVHKIENIPNFIEYSDYFASSGQPTLDDIQLLTSVGYERVIYLALTTNTTALAKEDEIVLAAGMQYIHIPVDFSKPKIEDFENFAALMQHDERLKTLVHCQVNFRASTFSFLYRVIYQQVPISEAKHDLDSMWIPNSIWYQFIVDTLASHKLSQVCEDCDWGEREFEGS